MRDELIVVGLVERQVVVRKVVVGSRQRHIVLNGKVVLAQVIQVKGYPVGLGGREQRQCANRCHEIGSHCEAGAAGDELGNGDVL